MRKIILVLLLLVSFCFESWAGRVDTIAVYSTSMHKAIPCIVIVPDLYDQMQTDYPVVYLLHGYGGNDLDWISQVPRLKNEVDECHVIIVCPDGGHGSWYLDSPVDSTMKYETFISKELLPEIDARYRTIPDRSHRAITGLSMGGHGAFFLALRHQDLFGAVGSMSGGVDIRPFPNNWDLKKRLGDIKTHRDNWEKNTVMNLVDSLKAGSLKIAFECGTADFFLQVNRALHEKLLRMKIDHDYTERPGQHNWQYWRNAVNYQLLFFRNYFYDR